MGAKGSLTAKGKIFHALLDTFVKQHQQAVFTAQKERSLEQGRTETTIDPPTPQPKLQIHTCTHTNTPRIRKMHATRNSCHVGTHADEWTRAH